MRDHKRRSWLTRLAVCSFLAVLVANTAFAENSGKDEGLTDWAKRHPKAILSALACTTVLAPFCMSSLAVGGFAAVLPSCAYPSCENRAYTHGYVQLNMTYRAGAGKSITVCLNSPEFGCDFGQKNFVQTGNCWDVPVAKDGTINTQIISQVTSSDEVGPTTGCHFLGGTQTLSITDDTTGQPLTAYGARWDYEMTDAQCAMNYSASLDPDSGDGGTQSDARIEEKYRKAPAGLDSAVSTNELDVSHARLKPAI